MVDKTAGMELYEHAERMNNVVQEYLKGQNVAQIAKTLGIKREDAVTMLDEFQRYASNHSVMQQHAKEVVVKVDHHYDKLIGRTYDVLDEAEQVGTRRERLDAIKTIQSIEKTRYEMMQSAGLIKQDELAERLLEEERKVAILTAIIREEVLSCPRCSVTVAARLSEVTDQAEVVTLGDAQ